MSPRRLRLGVVLGAAIAIVVVLVVRTHSQSRPGRDNEAAEPAPPPAPAPAASDGTHVTRARPAPPPAPPAQPPASDEASLTARARDSVRSDPERALALLDDADRAYPDGGLAEARAALRVDALVAAQRIGPARDAAEIYLAHYPHGPQAQRIEMLTGVHPRPAEPAN